MRRLRRARPYAASLLAMLALACGKTRVVHDTSSPAPQADTRRTLAFLGDSLTAGFGLAHEEAYPARVQALIDREGLPYRVIDAGVTGDTAAAGLARMGFLYRRHIDVLVVALGANDGLRGVPPATTEASLRAIVQRAKRERSRVVLAGMVLPENLGAEHRERFAAIYPRIAAEEGITLIPSLLEGVAMVPALNQEDGIHPNQRGAARIAETVFAHVAPLLREAR